MDVVRCLLLLTLFSFLLSGCANVYKLPENSKSAKIGYAHGLEGILFIHADNTECRGRQSLVFGGIKSRELASIPVSGEVTISHGNSATNYDPTDLTGDICEEIFAFTPEDGKTYLIESGRQNKVCRRMRLLNDGNAVAVKIRGFQGRITNAGKWCRAIAKSF